MYATPVASAEDVLAAAQRHLAEGAFLAAKAVLDEALDRHPDEAEVRELYANVYLAHGIRLSGEARETRRREIESRGRPGETFEDSEDVQGLFRESVSAFDCVLAVDPTHVKAMTLKAQVLFRLDRENREVACNLYEEGIRALETTTSDEEARASAEKNLRRALRQIEAPCERCDDTGFCTECTGSGCRTTLGIRRMCEACWGHGVCRSCGVL